MSSVSWSNRDSWPPTRLRLIRSSSYNDGPRPLLEDIDQDPLTYFLAPVESERDFDDIAGAFMPGFDAGIEDPKYSHEFIRSVSPSALDGLSKLRSKAVSPDLDSHSITTDEEDEEDFIRFLPSTSHPGITAAEDLRNPRSQPLSERSAPSLLAPAASFPGPSSPLPRGRPRQAMARSYSAGSRLPPRARRLWREPSPDVWSITEETEDELRQEALKPASGALRRDGQAQATKPKKQVRFLLSTRD